VTKLVGEVETMKTRVIETKDTIKSQASKLEKALASFEAQKSEKIGQIDDYFDKLLVKVAEARETIKAEFNELCESKNSQLSICITEYKKYMTKLDTSKIKVEKLCQEMSKLSSSRIYRVYRYRGQGLYSSQESKRARRRNCSG
jgi:hypothetical protein